MSCDNRNFWKKQARKNPSPYASLSPVTLGRTFFPPLLGGMAEREWRKQLSGFLSFFTVVEESESSFPFGEAYRLGNTLPPLAYASLHHWRSESNTNVIWAYFAQMNKFLLKLLNQGSKSILAQLECFVKLTWTRSRWGILLLLMMSRKKSPSFSGLQIHHLQNKGV